MAITVNLYYTGKNGAAKKFVREMISSGTVQAIKEAIDTHHNSPMMKKIIALRDKYDLHMRVERYVTDEKGIPSEDVRYIRN